MRHIEQLFLNTVAFFSRIAEVSGIYKGIRKLDQRKVIILMYHGVTSQHEPIFNFDHKHVEKEKFEKQLQYLKKNYTIISLEEFLQWKKGEKNLCSNPLLITFDDGYANNYTQAFPLLKKYNIPAVIFLPTKYIGKKSIAWYDIVTYCIASTEKSIIHIQDKQYFIGTNKQKIAAISELKKKCRDIPELRQLLLKEIIKETDVNPRYCRNEDLLFMTWDQCIEMQKNNIEFGSHGVSHEEMAMLNEQDIKKEMQQSKKIIERKLGKPCLSFAYPFGSNNKQVQTILRKTMYMLGFTILYGANTKKTDALQLRRIAVNNKYNLPIFTLNLCIHFQAFHHGLIVLYSKLRKCLNE